MRAMRGDKEYIIGVVDELEATVRDASGVPMRRGKALVDRSDSLVLLEELKEALPAELAEAEEIRGECDAIIEASREEAGRVTGRAGERAEARAWDSETCRAAHRRSAEIVERAERYAGEVTGGAERYRERIMGELEDWFRETLGSIGESREELSGASPRRVQPQERTEEDGRGWHANSA